MPSITVILLCVLFARATAADFGFSDGDFQLPPTFSRPSATRRQSRARVQEDDVACIDNLDLNPLNSDNAESLMSESIGEMAETSPFEEETTRYDNNSERLQLALSSSDNVNTQHSSLSNNDIPLSSMSSPIYRSTGTTIVGCLVEEGKYIVLGADTRATDDRMVADKDCEKIHCIAPNIWCCGAGTSADLEALTRQCQYEMALQALQQSSIGNAHLNDNTTLKQEGGILLQPVSVSAACRFLRDSCDEAGGSLGVNLILGGYDIHANENGGRLVAIHPHGSMDVVPYAALGSGGTAAMALLESRYRPSLTKQEGMELVKNAVLAGIENDLGSGSQVDMCVLGPNGYVDYQQGVVPEKQLESIAKHEESIDESIMSDASGGVNGFGNLPFVVNSRRVIASQHDETTRIEKWNALLGLGN